MDPIEKMTKHLLEKSIKVTTNAETGRKYLWVEGECYGCFDDQYGISVMDKVGTWTSAEKLVALTLIASGEEDASKIADLVLGFRQHTKSKK